MIRERLEILIRGALQTLSIEASDIKLEHPQDYAHGDYATNVALVYGKATKTAPLELAKKLVEELLRIGAEEIDKIEIAEPGFINFFLTKETVRKNISIPLESVRTKYTGKKVLIEHSSPNLFKPFHIGHLMNNIIGEFVVRAMTVTGGKVTVLSFPSDVSLGIAKGVFIIQKDGGLAQDVFSKSTEEIVNYLGDTYVRGVAYFKENPDEVEKLREIAGNLYTHTTSEEYDIYKKTSEININYFIAILQKLGSHFDSHIYESEAGAVGKKIVLENTPRVFTESQGAIVYIPDEERKDISTAVFINSQGNPTYEAKDVGLMSLKFERFNPDVSFFVTDYEQESHFRVVFASMMEIHKEWVENSVHIPHGRMTFKGQKMSSRLGKVPLALAVIDTVLEEVKERSGEKIAHLSENEQTSVQWQVALSALRVAILRAKPGSNINFDPDTSLSFEGDSGPYLLYTHARISTLLEKGEKLGFTARFEDQVPVTNLERVCLSFEDTLKSAIEEIAPQKLVTYLFRLAQEFNTYYGSTQIVVEGDPLSAHRLAVVRSVKNILKKGIWVLGIEAPERM